MRYFELVRHEDQSGVSGEGVVAVGAVTADGTAAMKWYNATNDRLDTNTDGISLKPAPDGAEATEEIHGHGGRTELVWTEEPPEEGLASELRDSLANAAYSLAGSEYSAE